MGYINAINSMTSSSNRKSTSERLRQLPGRIRIRDAPHVDVYARDADEGSSQHGKERQRSLQPVLPPGHEAEAVVIRVVKPKHAGTASVSLDLTQFTFCTVTHMP